MESDCDTGESTYGRSVGDETYTVWRSTGLSAPSAPSHSRRFISLGMLPKETLAEQPLASILLVVRLWLVEF